MNQTAQYPVEIIHNKNWIFFRQYHLAGADVNPVYYTVDMIKDRISTGRVVLPGCYYNWNQKWRRHLLNKITNDRRSFAVLNERVVVALLHLFAEDFERKDKCNYGVPRLTALIRKHTHFIKTHFDIDVKNHNAAYTGNLHVYENALNAMMRNLISMNPNFKVNSKYIELR